LLNKELELSVIIPAYNEEERLGKTLEKIVKYFSDIKFEIIVIDDGSSDSTREIAGRFESCLINPTRENRGKGYSIREGVLLSNGNKLLLCDADLATPIEEYVKLGKYIEQYPVVIGSRALKESLVESQPFRKFFGTISNYIIRLIVKDIRDTQCGFKLLTKHAADELFSTQYLSGFGYDFEILFLAQKKNFKIREVPIRWKHVDGSKVKFIHYFYTFFELLKVIYNNAKGKYE